MDDLAGGGCMPASSTPALGALYPLSVDFNLDPATGLVGLGTAAPSERLHLNGNLAFKAVDQGILFTSSNPFFAPAAPMMTMFAAGSSNPDRMVLAHSPLFSNYGLAYEDDEDRFVFQRSPSGPAVTIDLNQPSLWTSDFNGTQTTLLTSAPVNGGVVLARDSFGLIRAALGGQGKREKGEEGEGCEGGLHGAPSTVKQRPHTPILIKISNMACQAHEYAARIPAMASHLVRPSCSRLTCGARRSPISSAAMRFRTRRSS